MSIALKRLQESDVAAFTHAEFDSFRSHPRIPILWPRGETDDFWAYNINQKMQAFRSPESVFKKLVDTKEGADQLIAGAQWTVNLEPEQYAPKEPMQEDEPPPEGWPQDGNWQIRRWFTINSQKLLNRQMCGKPYIILDYLVVKPPYQGQGLGQHLLALVVDEADRRDVRICLESSPAGLSLYKKFGFQQIEVINCDMKKFGASVDYDEASALRIFMIREPYSMKPLMKLMDVREWAGRTRGCS